MSLQMHKTANMRFSLLGVALTVAVGLVVCGFDGGSTWHVPEASRRAGLAVPDSGVKAFRLRLPVGAEPERVQVVQASDGALVPHWIQTLEVRAAKTYQHRGKSTTDSHEWSRVKNGDVLVFYRVGKSHAYDHSQIAMRRSRDVGKTWSEERILYADPKERPQCPQPGRARDESRPRDPVGVELRLSE